MWKYYAIGLANYTNFRGRSCRTEFWSFVAVNVVLSLAVLGAASVLEHNWPVRVLTLLLIVPVIAAAVRRMHDTGRSGWYAIVPLYNLVLACQPGQQHDNRYGAGPDLRRA